MSLSKDEEVNSCDLVHKRTTLFSTDSTPVQVSPINLSDHYHTTTSKLEISPQPLLENSNYLTLLKINLTDYFILLHQKKNVRIKKKRSMWFHIIFGDSKYIIGGP